MFQDFSGGVNAYGIGDVIRYTDGV